MTERAAIVGEEGAVEGRPKGPGFAAKSISNAAVAGFFVFAPKHACNRRFLRESYREPYDESYRCPRTENRSRLVRFRRQGSHPENRNFPRRVLGRARGHYPRSCSEEPGTVGAT